MNFLSTTDYLAIALFTAFVFALGFGAGYWLAATSWREGVAIDHPRKRRLSDAVLPQSNARIVRTGGRR